MVRLGQLASAAALALSAAAADDASAMTNQLGQMHNQSLLWGPYKPNLYFGVRPRMPKGLWTGLMWSKIDHFTDVQSG